MADTHFVQARLPDTNVAWVFYRHLGVQSIKEHNYSAAVGAINEMIALFPDEYRIEINTAKYNELIRERLAVVCGNCKAEINRRAVQIIQLLVTPVKALITDNEVEDVWICPKCHKDNKLQNTQIIKEQQALPFYHKLIPEPPGRRGGLVDRRDYHKEMTKWFYGALEEVDHQLGKLRAEYEALEKIDEVSTQDAD